MVSLTINDLGELPEELGKLVNLNLFDARCNSIRGELPLSIIGMKVKGIIGEYNNEGFTIPASIGKLGDDITKLDLSGCSLTGPLSIRAEHFITFVR